MSTKTKECTRKEVEEAVSKWLSGSRDRDGKRTERQKREKSRREERERATRQQADGSFPDDGE
jgi:hypothetical protein